MFLLMLFITIYYYYLLFIIIDLAQVKLSYLEKATYLCVLKVEKNNSSLPQLTTLQHVGNIVQFFLLQ